MNIFDVLNQGKSRLHEPSISALLGYLLHTGKDHGLGDSFFRNFLVLLKGQESGNGLDAIVDKILSRPFVSTVVELEAIYELKEKRKDIDLQVAVLSGDKSAEKKEDYRFIIENKIKAGAANPKQLAEYYAAVLEDDDSIENLIVVFVTPKANHSALQEEYDRLAVRVGHHKAWVYWNDEDKGVLGTIQAMLEKEVRGELTPINEYMRHTLKAFVQHVNSVVSRSPQGSPRFGEDIGDIVEDVEVTLQNGTTYRVVRRDSGQVQVYLDDEKVMAKGVLREIIKERNFDIRLKKITTPNMGRQVLRALREEAT